MTVMTNTKCPYCKAKDFIPEVVWVHTEVYNEGTKNFECLHCKKIVEADCYRRIIVANPRKTNNENDWQ